MLNPLAHLVQFTFLWSQAGLIYLECFPPVRVIESCRRWGKMKTSLASVLFQSERILQRNSLFSPVPSSVRNVYEISFIFSLRKGYNILFSVQLEGIDCFVQLFVYKLWCFYLVKTIHDCKTQLLLCCLPASCQYVELPPKVFFWRKELIYREIHRGRQTAATAWLTRWATHLAQYDTF